MDSNADHKTTQPLGVASTEGLGLVGWVARNVYPREIPDPSLMIGDDKEEAEHLAGAYNSIYEIIPVYEQAAIDVAVAAEREQLAGGNDLEAMCEAFHRLIEAHANLRSPFHQPVCADAQMALRVLRGIVAGLRA